MDEMFYCVKALTSLDKTIKNLFCESLQSLDLKDRYGIYHIVLEI